MAYLLIIVLQLIGIGLHVAQKVLKLDNKQPDDTLVDVLTVFWKQDRITIFISGLILVLDVVGHYIVEAYAPALVKSIQYYELYSFALALVLGYAGQSIVYKYLGTAQKFLDKRADDLNNRYGGN